jgi:hypothetical protein
MSHEPNFQGSPAAADSGKKHALISDTKARQLFELALDLQDGRSAAAEWLSGREAVLAAVIADLRSGDALVTETTSDWNKEGRLPVAPRWPVGTGMADRVIASIAAATTDRLQKNGRVTAIFLPAANGDSLFAEARTMAAAAKLPVLFVEDARDRRRAANGEIDPNAMPSIPVDADDVVALYRVAHESIARARHGSGPTQITCVRWTLKNANREQHAIDRLEQWLTARGLPAQAWRKAVAARHERRPATAGYPAEAQLFAQPDIQTS